MATSAKKLIASISFFLLSMVATAQEYRVSIDARGKEITGICAMSQQDDCTMGTIMNEFGVKALDFSYNGKKAKLQNVFSPINKWYIKKVVRKDIAFLLANLNAKENRQKGKRTITFGEDGEIVMKNEKYNIAYTFTPLNDND